MDPSRAPGPARKPSVARETAEDIADDIKGLAGLAAQPLVDRVRASVTLWVLAVLFVPIGLILLVVSALLFMGLSSVIGPQSGLLAQLLGITWLVLTLGALVLVFRALLRRLPRSVRDHAVPGLRGNRGPADVAATTPLRNREPAASPRPAASLGELDARFAPRDPPA